MRKILSLVISFSFAFTARASVWYVDGSVSSNGTGKSWASALKNVQDGIDSAVTAGDEVWVKAGTYYPTEDPNGGTTASRDFSIYIKSNDIKLYGGFAGTETAAAQRDPSANVTILSGDINVGSISTNDAYHVLITISRSMACVVDGFTIKGGLANTASNFTVSSASASIQRNYGGGIFNFSSSPTVSHCTFSGNSVNSNGGGMYNGASSGGIVSNCTFSSNTASNGGGLYITAATSVSNCSFYNNVISGNGGGLYNGAANSSISSCRFIGNKAGTGGGLASLGGSPTLSSCVFSTDTATAVVGGGAMYINGSSSNASLKNCVFYYNVTTSSTGSGGGVFVASSNPSFSFCTFSRNHTLGGSTTGSALYFSATGTSSITNCAIWGNYCLGNPGNSSALSDEIGGTGPTPAYSDVRNISSGTGNFSSYPSFADTTDGDGPDNNWGTADDGLRISCSSSAKDAGNGSTTTLDIIGNTRTSTPDPGAYKAMAFSSVASNSIPSAYTASSLSQTAAALDYGDCTNEILKIDASSGTLSGSTIAREYLQSSAPSFNNQPYVRRYYDIAPASGAGTATATITLYFTQADFTDYNAAKPANYPSLPIDATDAAGNAANIRITQEHGTSSSGAPGTYQGWGSSGPANVLITPASVTWNSTASRWEVSFPVTGFSGFFAHTTVTGSPLPIGLTVFTAKLVTESDVALSWHVANPADSKEFIVERSSDGAAFSPVGLVTATAANNYSLHDYAPPAGRSYYRLHIMEQDGKISYSNVESITVGGRSYMQIMPSPAHDYFVVATNTNGLTGTLTDIGGGLKMRFTVSNEQKVNISGLPAGLYLLTLSNGAVIKVVKE